VSRFRRIHAGDQGRRGPSPLDPSTLFPVAEEAEAEPSKSSHKNGLTDSTGTARQDKYTRIRDADDWKRQLGSSSSGFVGAVIGGWAAGSAIGAGLGALELNPVTIAGGTFIGGMVGSIVGYELVSGIFDQIYDIIKE
jgi:hypothetical protein